MSKQKLEKALQNAINATKKYREGTVNKHEHVYYVDKGTIIREILNALNSFIPEDLSSEAKQQLRGQRASKLSKAVDTYTSRLYKGFNDSSPASSVLFQVAGGPPTFAVRCTENPKTAGRTKLAKNKKGKLEEIKLNADFYRAINKIRTASSTQKVEVFTDEQSVLSKITSSSPLDALRAEVLSTLFGIDVQSTGTDISGVTNTDGKDLYDIVLGAKKKGKRQGGLLHLGHLEGFAVVEKRALEIYKRVTKEIEVDLGSAVLTKVLSSRQKASKGKMAQFLIELKIPEDVTIVMDEDMTGNISKEQERKMISDLTAELFANNWAKQEGSMDSVSATVYDLQEILEESIKSLKPKKSKKPKGQRNAPPVKTKKLPITGTAQVSKTSSNESFPASSGKASIEGNNVSKVQNWSSLIAILNKKLPEQVAGNMGSPGLNYRTGRLANSSEIVNIETTKDGYPSIVYSYQRDPYDVFDKTLGKAPWNTPSRDPRTLVDRSVREIVQEMAIGRFYTRRA